MQAAEALTLMIGIADNKIAYESERLATGVGDTFDAVQKIDQAKDELERLQLAVAVSQAMLNSMIAVARFRAFVEVDAEQPKRTKVQQERAIHSEFTICGTTMDAIRSGLLGLSSVPTNCRVLVFEQRATGADVLTGFQGQSKTQKFRLFLKDLDQYETLPTVN